MSHSATVTSTHSRTKIHSSLMVLLIVLAVIGLVDSTYLSINHFIGAYLACSPNAKCDEVLGSEFSALGSVPVAALGAIYYATIIALTVASRRWPSLLYRYLPFLTVIGLAVSIYLVSLQAFVLQAFCTYCLVSAAVCLLLFVVTMLLYLRNRSP